ncbi:hypothetical protein K470DRAFT_222491 [Piedraia hortae CBS 480.64]|uniref:Protein CASP n=1 Tax=Piedraia hortae CBS 480.64 TaxID=1314780 RepID=A0A6A7BRJ5_9PEZI|nr:hypothetical protein K470DRAFT_222491 [Piedraia hortae CBS 480.64]
MQATPGAESNFHAAVAAWRSLQLGKLVPSLDAVAADLVNRSKDALLQRKELAQKTKDFRRLDDEAKLAGVKELLKAYQTYIDGLTGQNKTVQAAFMQVYEPLSDAPDPYPLLDASADAIERADRAEADRERLQQRVAKLDAHLEQRETELESERSNRQALEASQTAKAKEIEDSWSAVLKEKEDNWAAKEKSFTERAENQERLLKEIKANYEVSQRLERDANDEGRDRHADRAVQAELDILASDLEKANVRLVELETRNEQLRLELAQSAGHAAPAVEDDPAFLRLRSENQSLRRKLESAAEKKKAESSSMENRIRTLEREIRTLEADRTALENKLSKWSNYDEIRRELEMLRDIENIDEAEDTDNLERLLLTRNKKLNNDYTELRVSHNELQQRLGSLQEELSGRNMELEQARETMAKLELEVERSQQAATDAFETMSVAQSKFPKSVYGSRRAPSPTSSIIGIPPAEPAQNPSSILPMVTAQRDRFKKRTGELELELQRQYQTVSSLRSEVASLQRDNLDLYEKTRYMSSYRGATAQSTGSAVNMDRYKSAYEQNISPFAAFRGRESARALKRLSFAERAIYQATKMVLATRTSRNLFAAYCIGLHLMVLALLYRIGSVDVERHSPDWRPEVLPKRP